MNMYPHLRGRLLLYRSRRKASGSIAAFALVLAVLTLISASGTRAATSATLNEPTTPILDSFNGRGLEDPLDQWGNWADASVDGIGQTMESFGATAGHNEGSVVADSYRPEVIAGDAEVYATLATLPDNNAPTYLYLHLGEVGGPGWDGYRLRLERWVSTVADTVSIQKISNGVETYLASTGVAPDFQVGQTFVLRRTANTLTVWRKHAGVWSQLLSASNVDLQSGMIGFGSNDGTVRWDDFGGSGSTTPEPPPPTLPETTVLDTFNRPDEDPLSQGGAWASAPIAGTGQTLEVLGNRAGHNEAAAGDSYRDSDVTGDAEVFATMAATPDNNAPLYLFLHLGDVGGSGWDGYRVRLERWVSTVADTAAIQKVVDGQPTTLVSAGVGPPDLQAGDVFLLRRVGNALELWRKNAGTWTRRMSTSDDALTRGMPGFGCADTICRWDDFGGGAIGAPPATTSLTVVKTVVNDDGGTTVASDWTMNVAGPTPLSFPGAASPGTTNTVEPGAYRVTESGGPAGYTLTYSGHCDADGDVTLALGETKTCVLTNDDPAASAGPPPAQTFGAGQGGRGMHAWCGCAFFADPVSSRTGAFTTSADDLDVPGTGVSLAWSRNYTSADPTVGRLGPGWTDSYSASLGIQPNGDVLMHGEDGQQVYYAKQGDGSLVGAPGSLSTLSSIAGGYELVRTDQVAYLFDAQGRLTSIKDRSDQGVTLAYDGQGRLVTVTDAANRQTTISYNPGNLVSQVQTQDGRAAGYGYTNGRLTSVTDVRGKSWTYTYDAGGRLEKVVDPLSHAQVTNVYGADARVQSQRDALDKVTTFTWDAGTETATATDANQKVWTHDYEDDVLVEEMDPLGNDIDLVLDDDLNTTAVTGPTDETTQMTYDAAGNLLTATAPPSLGSAQKTFVYNARNDVDLATDARGKVTDYTYNPTSGDLTSVVQDGIQVGAYTYDAAGRVETLTDGNEKTSTYTYFPATGYLQSSTDPLGNKTTYTYDGAGRVATRVDPKGNVAGCNCAADFSWTYTYNPAGQQLTEQNPLGHTTTNVYDDAGRLTSTSDPLGRTTSYTYDDANRALTETAPDPDGAGPLTEPITTYTYDNVGNKLTETDPRGNTTTFAYDDANRLVSTTGPDPDGAGPQTAPVTTHTHDANGNLTSTVEPRGNVSGADPDEYRTTFTNDAAGRMLTETQPDPDGAGPSLPPRTTNIYDALGNLASAKDGNDHVTAYTHDAAGHILTVAGPDGGLTTYTYDDVGNVLSRHDDNNHTTIYSYDGAGRLASETSPDPDGPGPQGSAVTSYTYDPNGNRLTVTDPNGNATPTVGDGVTTHGYDRADRLTSIDHSDTTPDVTFTYDAAGNRLSMVDGSGTETRTYDGLDRVSTVTRGSNTFSYVYDAASNVTRRTYPGSTVVDYTYDPLDRLATVVTSSNTTSYTYDAASNLVQTTLPSGNGYAESRVYDRAGRLTEVENQRATSVLSHFVSTLDPVGNPTQVVRTGSLAETQTYTYDANDRITGVCVQAGRCPGASDPFVRWTYDKVGNRLSEQRPTGTISYTYDARDRLLSAGSTSFAYDQNGNQTQKGTRTFAYDLANRLKSTTQSSSTTTYAYDGDGKRLEAVGEGTAGAPTLRTPCSTATGDSGTATVNKPTGTVQGDLLIVGLAFEKGSDVTLTPPSGWTLIRRANQSSNVGYATYRKFAGASEGASYAFTLTPSPKWSIGSCAIAGADQTAPIDVHNGSSAASGNPSAPSVTTTGASRLVLAFYANKKPATYSSYTSPAVERFDAPNVPGGLPSNAMASYERPATGATGAKSATVSEQAEWVAQQIAIASAPGGSTTRFLWDVNQGLPQLALERDANNNPLRRYVYGERRISQTAGTDASYFLHDGLGSVANLTSSSGATQWTYAHEPFGATRIEISNSGPTNFMKFTGEYLDPTGLYHLRARQYDSGAGRFMRPDPLNPRVGASYTASYAYVDNRPTVMVDPSGQIFQAADHATVMGSFAGSAVNWRSPNDFCQSPECGPLPKLAPRRSLVHPIPAGFAFTVCQGNHGTAGLAGYVARDFCARQDTPVLAVQSGILYKWSGHNPRTYVDQRRGIFGWSLYLRADSGADYFYTHLGARIPESPSGERRVRAGQTIGRIGDWLNDRPRSHLHLGVAGGAVTIEMVGRAPRVRVGG